MATFYFSGIDRTSFIELLAKEGAAGMVNQQVAGQRAMLAAYARFPEVKLVLDSGAFQGFTDIQAYIGLLKAIGNRFEWFANLDVIGNQQASNDNFTTIHNALPDDLKHKLLWIYQSGSMGYLASVADTRRFVGVGGLVPVIKRNVNEAVNRIGEIGRVLERTGAGGHFFGVSSPDILLEYRNASWFISADSQAWITGFKALELIRSDGSRVSSRALGFLFEKSECAAQNIRTIHSWLNADVQLAFEAMRL